MVELGEEEVREAGAPQVEVTEYLKQGIDVCKESAREAGVDGDGLRKATKKCCIQWLKAEEYKTEHRFATKAQGIFVDKFDELYGEKPAKEESE